MHQKLTAAAAALALASLALVACAGPATAPASSPTPTASATPTPSPEPTPATAALVVDGAGFELVDGTGATTFAHVWASEVAPAVAALSAAFGAEPVVSFEDNDNTHYADFDVYTWEGVFALGDAVGLEKPRAEYFLASFVRVQAAAVAGVAVRSRSGPGVGSTVAEVAAVVPVLREQWDPSYPAVYRIDAADPSLDVAALSAEPTDMVGLVADAADTSIVRLLAPDLSFSPI